MNLKLISLTVCFVLFDLLCAVQSESLAKQRNAEDLLDKAMQLTSRLSKASSRGMTSSQVIEYSPRNIALMTLLNSMLIVGGLLGTMSRNDKAFPFKRVDTFSKLKKRFLPSRRSNAVQPPIGPMPIPFHPIPVVPPVASPRPVGLFPMPNYLAKPSSPINVPVEFEINPRIPVQIVRRTDDLVSDSRSSAESACDHVLRCFDAFARPYYPSLSELSKSALKLLNDATDSKLYVSLLAKVRELIELEQKGGCLVQYTCARNRPLVQEASPSKSA